MIRLYSNDFVDEAGGEEMSFYGAVDAPPPEIEEESGKLKSEDEGVPDVGGFFTRKRRVYGGSYVVGKLVIAVIKTPDVTIVIYEVTIAHIYYIITEVVDFATMAVVKRKVELDVVYETFFTDSLSIDVDTQERIDAVRRSESMGDVDDPDSEVATGDY